MMLVLLQIHEKFGHIIFCAEITSLDLDIYMQLTGKSLNEDINRILK